MESRRVYWLSYTVSTILYATRKCPSLVKSALEKELRFSRFTLGMIDGAFLLSYTLFQFLLPLIGDRVGSKPVLVVLFVGAGLAMFLFIVSTISYMMIALSFCIGVFHSSMYPLLAKTISSQLLGPRKDLLLGLWVSSVQIGGIVGTFTIVFMNANFGWKWAYILMGSLMTLSGLCILGGCLDESFECKQLWSCIKRGIKSLPLFRSPTLSNRKSQEDNEVKEKVIGKRKSYKPDLQRTESDSKVSSSSMDAFEGSCDAQITPLTRIISSDTNTALCVDQITDKTEASKDETSTLSFLEALMLPGLVLCSLAYFCTKYVRYTILFWLPYYLNTALMFDDETAGYVSLSTDVGGILASVLLGYLTSRYFSKRKLLVLTFLSVASTSFLVYMVVYSSELESKKISAAEVKEYSTASSIARSNVTNMGTIRLLEYSNQNSGIQNDKNVSSPSTLYLISTIVVLFFLGFFVSGVDYFVSSVLPLDFCLDSKNPKAKNSIATCLGIVNGMGSAGSLLQSLITSVVSSYLGWTNIFIGLVVIQMLPVPLLWVTVLPKLRKGRLHNRSPEMTENS